MNTKMNPIFTDNILSQLAQLPEGTVIDIGKDDITVFKNFTDYDDHDPVQHRFFRTTLWVDEKGE